MMARSLLIEWDEMTDKAMPDERNRRPDADAPTSGAEDRGDASVARTSESAVAASKDGNDRVDAPTPPSTTVAAPLITAVEIENFKGIGRPMRVEFRPITLLFGNNSAGKSTVLHALCYAHEILSHRQRGRARDRPRRRPDRLGRIPEPRPRSRSRSAGAAPLRVGPDGLGDAHCAIRQATLRLRGRPCRLRIDRVGGEDHVWMDRTAG